jgi:glycosyltransferase involved in cell wall biosynthesis
MKVVVSQKGAREHFLAARALHRKGALACLVVDWYVPKARLIRGIFSFVTRYLGSSGRAAMAARVYEIPDTLIKVNWINGLIGKWRQRSGRFRTSSQQRNMKADIAFTKTVARMHLPDHDVFFGYSYMSLEMLEIEKKKGVLTILDQIDPGPVEFRLVAEETSKYPELSGPTPAYPAAYYERLRREWDLADVIVVNSEWSRDALISEGVPTGKIEVLPLAYDAEKSKIFNLSENGEVHEKRGDGTEDLEVGSRRPLHVLWLGQVNVRKGIHYLIEAARILEGSDIDIDIVGPIEITPDTLASAPSNMTFHGSVSRDRTVHHYRQADVFVLPTLSDGFAITQLEAMAYGLPVITTPNCGKVVQNGKNGFVVPPSDAKALAEAISRFDGDRELAMRMSGDCLETVKEFSIENYGDRLMGIIRKHRNC